MGGWRGRGMHFVRRPWGCPVAGEAGGGGRGAKWQIPGILADSSSAH